MPQPAYERPTVTEVSPRVALGSLDAEEERLVREFAGEEAFRRLWRMLKAVDEAGWTLEDKVS